MSNELSRRDFLGACSAAACAVTLSLAESSGSPPGAAYTGTLCLFSKPLPGMDWRRLAQAAKSLGFGGIDLTVRRGGHVQPERAAEDLPKAVVAIRDRKSTRLNSSHGYISYAVFCLKKKKTASCHTNSCDRLSCTPSILTICQLERTTPICLTPLTEVASGRCTRATMARH